MSENIKQKPEIKQPDEDSKPNREKEIEPSEQSSTDPVVEKSTPRQRRAEVQNPLMHESY